MLFSEIALSVCQQEQIDMRFNCLDTSSFSLSGEYVPQTDEQAIVITHGYSKDHRPDLKQAVLELMVSQDGGVPFISQSRNGNASDTTIFKERCEALLKEFQASETPRYLIADSKLYTEENASNLACLSFITRIPETLTVTQQLIDQALGFDQWETLDATYKYQRIDLCHYGIEQRWLIVYSKAAALRAEKTLAKAQAKEYQKVQKELFHLQAQRFDSKEEAFAALEKIIQSLRYHRLTQSSLSSYIQYAHKGKPTPQTPIKAIGWQITASVAPAPDKITKQQHHKACFVLGTSIPDTSLTDAEVFTAYKEQTTVEHGFRFLKDPLFFVSSLFVKKPSRIQGLLMVMTLALLVYAVAQRHLRNQLEQLGETLPNQIIQPTSKPTLRWIFQLLDGIHRVILSVQGHITTFIEGLTDLRRKILRLFGQKVCQLYQISSA